MHGVLIKNSFYYPEKFRAHTELLCAAFAARGVPLRVLGNADCRVMLSKTLADPLPDADFVLFWDKDIALAKALQAVGHRVFNSAEAIFCCDHKTETHIALAKAGLAQPLTVFAPFCYNNREYTDFGFVKDTIARLGLPLVVKHDLGSFGTGVFLAKTEEEVIALTEKFARQGLLYQQYLTDTQGEDFRIYVAGGQVVTAMRRRSENDFRANASLSGSCFAYTPSDAECRIAIEATRAVGADFAGVDLLRSKGGMFVSEVNSNAHFIHVLETTGVNFAEAMAGTVLQALTT